MPPNWKYVTLIVKQSTKPQAIRLFGVAPSVCAAMLRALVMENFLSRTGDGLFVRSTTH